MKKCKNILYILVVLSTFIISNFSNTIIAANGVSISGPTIVIEGQNLVFTIKYDNNVSFIKISDGDIILNGFAASSKSVSGSGQIRTVKLTNVRKTSSEYGSITINSGTGYLNSVTKLPSCTSNTFKIKTQEQIKQESTRPPENNNNTNNNNPTTNNNNNNNTNTNTNTNVTPNTNNPQTNQENNNNNNNNNNSNNQNTNNEQQIPENNNQNNDKPEINYDEVIPNPNTGKEI